MSRRLSELQEKFCHEYWVDFDPEAAVVRAGYKFKSEAEAQKIAQKNLSNPIIQRRLAEVHPNQSALDPRQKKACRLFLAGGKTQSEAYQEAGYSGTPDALMNNASRLFARSDIKRYLRDLNEKLSIESDVDFLWILRQAVRWVETGNVAISDICTIDSDGTLTVKDLSTLPRHITMAIQEIRRIETYTEEAGMRIEFKLKLHKRDTASLKLIARMIGADSDWQFLLRVADKYGYEVKKTPYGYALIGPDYQQNPAIEAEFTQVPN